MNRPKTIFCDIDGTLVEHANPIQASLPDFTMKVLNGTHKVLNEWDRCGYRIILTTGRKESLRSVTEAQLSKAGIIYDKLIMGLGGGDRILINDNKKDGRRACWALNPERDSTLKNFSFYNLSELAKNYFKLYSNKDLDGITKMFRNDVVLKDWEGQWIGIDKVVNQNRIVFESIQELKIEVEDISCLGNKVFAKIIVHANGIEVPVVDIIEFDNQEKIVSITAYRGN